MNDYNIYELIGRSFSGEATQQDHDAIESWKQQSHENLVYYQQLKNVWENSKIDTFNKRSDVVYENVLKKIDEQTRYKDINDFPKKSGWTIFLRVAAILVIIVSSAIVAYQFGKKNIEEVPVVTEVVKSNPIGQKSKVYLPDGSTVILNSESSIKYLEPFEGDVRMIELIGEAFFDVKKDQNRPFVVKTANITTTVLGTTFNINAYPNQKNIVSIATGKVKVSLNNENKDHYIVADAGESVIYEKELNNLKRLEIAIDDLLAWKDGGIVFQDSTFPEIMEKLSKWYGVKFSVNGKPHENWKYTGRFNNEYLTNILESISYGREFQYQVKDKNVIITFNKR